MFLAKSESGSEAPKMASRPACKKHKREIRQFPGPFLKGGGGGGRECQTIRRKPANKHNLEAEKMPSGVTVAFLEEGRGGKGKEGSLARR